MKKKGPKWRVDWPGGNPPEVGQTVAYLTPTNQCSHARVVGVRVVKNRNPLPPGAVCRYEVSIERIELKPGETVAWTCYAYPRKRLPKGDPSSDTWSPLL